MAKYVAYESIVYDYMTIYDKRRHVVPPRRTLYVCMSHGRAVIKLSGRQVRKRLSEVVEGRRH